MKKTIYFLLTFVLILTTISLKAQTKTWVGPTGNWSDDTKWSPPGTPGVTADVIIPIGKTLDVIQNVHVRSLTVVGGTTSQGTTSMDIHGNITLDEASIFEEETLIDWVDGEITANNTLIVNGIMSLTSADNKTLNGSMDVGGTLDVDADGTGGLFTLGSTAILKIKSTSTFDFKGNSGLIAYSGNAKLINEGVIDFSEDSGTFSLNPFYENNGGTITLIDTELQFVKAPSFNGGIFNVDINSAILIAISNTIIQGDLTGLLNGPLSIGFGLVIPASATFNFTGIGIINLNVINILGGGVLTNNNIINLTGPLHRISGDTTLDNQGILNLTSDGDLWIQGSGSILNNPIGGIIDIQADSANIHFNGAPGVLNNAGLIKKTTSTGESFISIPINNNDGILQVEVGTLSFQNQTTDKNFNDGTYNVFAGATMDWDTIINPSGTLEGTIVGDLNWNSFINIPTGETATINFSETDNFNWKSGNLNGGGTLINANVLKLKATSVPYRISEATTLDNQGILIFTSGGNLWIDENCILNNPIGGIIDMQADGGNISWNGTAGVLNNAGLIKRTTTVGQAFISVVLNNSGTIQIETGELEIANSQPFTNEVTGIVKGVGIFDLPLVANYTNNGTFAPGLSPGILSVQGNYTSTASSILDVELDGLTQGTEYDLLAIQGNANFDGNINVTLGFSPNINDEFIIATTTGTINSFNFPATGSTTFNGTQYEYTISQRNNNEVVINVTNAVVNVTDNELVASQIVVFPNPVNNRVTLQNESNINLISATLFEASGRIIKKINLKDIQESKQISLNNLSSGYYFLKIVSELGIINKTIIKK